MQAEVVSCMVVDTVREGGVWAAERGEAGLLNQNIVSHSPTLLHPLWPDCKLTRCSKKRRGWRRKSNRRRPLKQRPNRITSRRSSAAETKIAPESSSGNPCFFCRTPSCQLIECNKPLFIFTPERLTAAFVLVMRSNSGSRAPPSLPAPHTERFFPIFQFRQHARQLVQYIQLRCRSHRDPPDSPRLCPPTDQASAVPPPSYQAVDPPSYHPATPDSLGAAAATTSSASSCRPCSPSRPPPPHRHGN